MSRVVLRPATKSDFDALTEGPRPYRVRAFAGEVDGRVVGIGGLAYLPNGVIGAFVQATDEARKYPVAMHKAGLMAMAEARRLGFRRVVAMADKGVEPAERWLKRLGFKPETVGTETVYVWES